MIHPHRDMHSWCALALLFAGIVLFGVAMYLSQPEIGAYLREQGIHGAAPTLRQAPQHLFVLASSLIIGSAFVDVRRRLSS